MTESASSPHRAVVSVGVTTLWAGPDAPRGCDAPAVRDVPDAAAWVAGLTDDERRDLPGRTLSQLLLGDAVIVDELVGGWARVVAVDQVRSRLDPRGYPGWIPVAHLVPVESSPHGCGAGPGEQYVVDVLTSTLCDEPGGRPVLDAVLGTRLFGAGEARNDDVPVAVPGRLRPLWAHRAELATPAGEAGAQDIVRTALRFQGVRYVWGGTSPYGIDCSGLVHLVHRRFGVRVPRDADDQADAAEPADGQLDVPGRLVFFRDDNRYIDHVGIIASAGQLLHASGSAGQVRSEPFPTALAARIASVRRFVA